MRLRFLILALSILFGIPEAAVLYQSSTPFLEFLAKYRASSETSRRHLAESYIQRRLSNGGFPIVEDDGTVVFLYLGEESDKTVRLVGDFRPRSFYNVYWDKRGIEMTRVSQGGPLFIKKMKFEKDARLDYKFVVDGEYINDSLNQRTVYSGTAPPSPGETVATASELRMPSYRPTLDTISTVLAKGHLKTVGESWAQPKITLYLPPSYDSKKSYPVVYTADGDAWLNFFDLPGILDNLIATDEIQPVVAVMIDAPRDRSTWYLFNPDYLAYIERVIEFVDSRYSTRARAEERLHVGTSAGGRATLYVGSERPGLFGNLGMLSPSLTGPPHYFEPYFRGKKHPDAKLKIWLSAGSYEGYIYKDTELMERYFKDLGLEVEALYTREGHSIGTWRNAVPVMLKYFFGQKTEPSSKH
jgi:enterochelin esterase-like enzyme